MAISKKERHVRALRQTSIDLRLMARLYVEAQHIDKDGREIEDAFDKLSKAAIAYTLERQ